MVTRQPPQRVGLTTGRRRGRRGPQDAVVVAEQRGREIVAAQRRSAHCAPRPAPPRRRASFSRSDGLLLAPLRPRAVLKRTSASLISPARRSWQLHEAEDLFLDLGLLLLDLLDLGEDGGVFLVGLDLVEAAPPSWCAWRAMTSRSFSLARRSLRAASSSGLEGRPASSCASASDGVDGGDLLRAAAPPPPRGAAMRASNALELDQCLELDPLMSPTVSRDESVGPLGLEPRPDRL